WMRDILTQCNAADVNVNAIKFIGADVSMDSAKDNTKASLYVLKEGTPVSVFRGSLKDTNLTASDYDSEISALIREEKIDGLILMCIDSDGVNKQEIFTVVK